MKTKITILLISLFLLAFSAQAVAQDKSAPFTAITLDTDDSGYVDAIDVYVTYVIIDNSTNWSNLVDDFEVSGFSSSVNVEDVTTGAVADDNVFRIDISSSENIPTSITSFF